MSLRAERSNLALSPAELEILPSRYPIPSVVGIAHSNDKDGIRISQGLSLL